MNYNHQTRINRKGIERTNYCYLINNQSEETYSSNKRNLNIKREDSLEKNPAQIMNENNNGNSNSIAIDEIINLNKPSNGFKLSNEVKRINYSNISNLIKR